MDDEIGSGPSKDTSTSSLVREEKNSTMDDEISSGPSKDTSNLLPKTERIRIELPKNRTVLQNFVFGQTDVLSANYESLDYDSCENYLYLEEERLKGYKYVVQKNVCRWLMFILIGVCTAFVGIFIDVAIDQVSNFKYKKLKHYLDESSTKASLLLPTMFWICANVAPVLVGSLLVTYVEPIALGSGIPQVKCYLNGVKMPRLVRFKTLFVKTIGVITTVVGGLAGGKEGPMIHSGAVVAAGLTQGKSTSFKIDLNILKFFREDHEKRDFVSGGAAAGVAAAFGAPVGGVLFSLEEGASFWNQSLTWRIFLASMVSSFTLNIVLSMYHHYPGLSYSGLLNFGKFDSLDYELFELVIFVLIGATGGIFGAIFNHLNFKIAVFRTRYMSSRPYLKVLEALIVAAVSAIAALLMIYTLDDCKPIGLDPAKYPAQMYCPDGKYSASAALWLQVPEATVRSLFHDPLGSFDTSTIVCFAIVYYILSLWTYGLSVSSGIFIPNLVIGAAWGRLIGIMLQSMFPDIEWHDTEKYALAGAAAQLGGVVRMTISLTVILIEATGSIAFGLPLMLILITAKWVGDFFTEGLYDMYINLSGIPLLAWEPPPLSSNVHASDVMSYPIATFKTIENVGRIMDVLQKETHNGFPVVDSQVNQHKTSELRPKPGGHLQGMILRHQLIILLKNKLFHEVLDSSPGFSLELFRRHYPRYPTIEDVSLTDQERNYTIDLRPFMNPSPYVILHTASLPRIFRMFRALGLRHLVVINDTNEVVGMITRKDLARYKVSRHLGHIRVDEIKISSNL